MLLLQLGLGLVALQVERELQRHLLARDAVGTVQRAHDDGATLGALHPVAVDSKQMLHFPQCTVVNANRPFSSSTWS